MVIWVNQPGYDLLRPTTDKSAENISPCGPNGDFHGPRYSRFAVDGLQLHLEVPWP